MRILLASMCVAVVMSFFAADGSQAQERPWPGRFNVTWPTAGGLQYWGDKKGYNPWVAGDDDGVVPLSSAKLAGARDFRLLPTMHVMFPREPQVQKLTLKFLQKGHFESDEKREPL